MRLPSLAYRIALSLTMLSTVAGNCNCWAMSSSDVVNAINSAHVLDSHVGLNARVDKDKVTISTYRDPKNNDTDTKIDAVMMAKAVSEASKDTVSKINVCFFGEDMSKYQQVSISAGDLKAFASGQTSKEQLLSSLSVDTVTMENGPDKVTRALESAALGRPDYRVSIKKDQALVSTTMGSWLSDADCRLEAVRIATTAVNALPDSIKDLKIAFVDPNGVAQTREISFDLPSLQSTWKAVEAVLKPVAIARQNPSVDIQGLSAQDGLLQEDRQKLISRIKDLDSKGIGMAPFARAFMAIEKLVTANADEATIKAQVDHLNSSLDDQEKAYKAAKDHPIQKTAVAPPSKLMPSAGSGRWGALGNVAIDANRVLDNPGTAASDIEQQLSRQAAPNKNERYATALDEIGRILTQHGRGAEAQTYIQKAAAVRAALKSQRQ